MGQGSFYRFSVSMGRNICAGKCGRRGGTWKKLGRTSWKGLHGTNGGAHKILQYGESFPGRVLGEMDRMGKVNGKGTVVWGGGISNSMALSRWGVKDVKGCVQLVF